MCPKWPNTYQVQPNTYLDCQSKKNTYLDFYFFITTCGSDMVGIQEGYSGIILYMPGTKTQFLEECSRTKLQIAISYKWNILQRYIMSIVAGTKSPSSLENSIGNQQKRVCHQRIQLHQNKSANIHLCRNFAKYFSLYMWKTRRYKL